MKKILFTILFFLSFIPSVYAVNPTDGYPVLEGVDYGSIQGTTTYIGGTAGVSLTGANGSITLLGKGDGFDEALTADFNTTSNTVGVSSSTGVTLIDFGTIDLSTDTLTLTGTGTLNGLDAVDATTEATLEDVIDHLPNLAVDADELTNTAGSLGLANTATARTAIGLGTGDSPTFTGLDLTGLTDGYVPYVGVGTMANSPFYTDGTYVALGSTTIGAKFDLWNGSFYLSDDDVAHGMTGLFPTNTYATFYPISGTVGGMSLTGVTDADRDGAFFLSGFMGTDVITAGNSVVRFRASKKNGTTIQSLADTDVAFSFENNSTRKVSILGNGATTINDNDGVDNEIMLTIGDANDEDDLLVYGNISSGTDPADTGDINLSNGGIIAWEDGTEYTITHVDNVGLNFSGNIMIGLSALGTSADKVLGLANATPPTTSPANASQIWSADLFTTDGYARLHERTEDGVLSPLALKYESDVQSTTKAQSLGVSMTTASSGSNGIVILDNNNLDMGTNDYTLVWRGTLPDWTPDVQANLIYKLQSGALVNELVIKTSGPIRVDCNNHAGSGVANPEFVNNTEHMISSVITRENPSANGSFRHYTDGLPYGALISIAAGATDTVSNTGNLYILGSTTTRTVGIAKFATIYNRGLTSTEMLQLFQKGIDPSDQWGSQTELMSNAVDRDFSGASAWAKVDVNAYDETTDLTITANAAAQYCTLPVASMPTTIGYHYRIRFDVANIVGTWTIKSFDGTQTIGTVSANGTQESFEWIASTTGGLRLVAVANNSSGDFDNFTLVKTGAVWALEGEGIQPNPGQWLDSSTNKLHAMQPAAGSSLTRKQDKFEVRWTNTWAGAHAAQNIGGLDQAILPANCYITDIIGVITGATIEDIIIGDGSDVDRWVTITTGLAAGTYAFTLANRVSDGTNYELLVDPDNNFTGSIAWTIRGIILQ